MREIKKFHILGAKISAIDMDDALSSIEEAILKREKIYICVCPVSTVMECRKSEKVLASVNCAQLATPDGMAVVWIGRMLGHRNLKRVYGPELMQRVCGLSAGKGYKNYLYGSTPEVLNKLKEKLNLRYAGLTISGIFSPPFGSLSKEEDDEITGRINNCCPDIIWVGLGSPKQDLWMHEHRDRISAPVMIGVGAAFDFLSGNKPQAPGWIRNNGFEWLFRLISEPRRLWRRYLVDYPLFIYYASLDLIPELLSRRRLRDGKGK